MADATVQGAAILIQTSMTTSPVTPSQLRRALLLREDAKLYQHGCATVSFAVFLSPASHDDSIAGTRPTSP